MNHGVFELNGKYFVYACDASGEATGDPVAGPFDTPDQAKQALDGMKSAPAPAPAPAKPQPVKADHTPSGDVEALKAEVAALKAKVNAAPVAAGGFANVKPANEGKPFKSFGEQLQAIARVTRNGGNDNRLDEVKGYQTKALKAIQGSNESIASEGGFPIQTDFEPQIVKRAYEESALARRTRKTGISANANGLSVYAVDETSRVRGSRWGGVQVYWLGEGGTPTKSKPKLRKVGMDLGKVIGLWYATDEVLSDSSALNSLAMEVFPAEIAYEVDEAIFTGIGGAIPLGVLNSPAFISVSKESGQAAATIVYENIVKMWARVWAKSWARGEWFANQSIYPQLDQMALTVGTGALEPRFVRYNEQGVLTIKGRPVNFIEQAKALGTLGDLTFLDLNEYRLIDKDGIQTASSIHVEFLTDQTAFRFVYRVNGQPEWNAPLTPANGSDTLSPFVGLATRA